MVAALVFGVGFWLVNKSADSLGALGITRMPNSGMAMRYLTISTTAGTASAGTDGALSVGGTASITGETRAPVVETGSITTLTATSTATVLTAAQVCDSNVIQWDTYGVSSTLTFPAATTTVADCLTTNGDSITLLFDNITTSTSAVVTLTAGTGIELVGSGSGDDLIDGENQAFIRLTRTSATALIVEVEELVAAD